MLMMSVVAGTGLMGIKKFGLPERIGLRLRVPPIIAQSLGLVLGLVLIGFTLGQAIPAHQQTPYYHMIDSQDYEAFTWIRDNVEKAYDKAILDPWKGTAFTAITGKHIYTRIHAYPKASDEEAYEFLSGGCTNTTFLTENEISIVYTLEPCHNLDLIEVRESIYLLKEAEDQ
jgi:hypothetical protein